MVGKQIAGFVVNGRAYEIIIEPHWTLNEVLRDCLGLTGTKMSCGVGQCGACTVLVEDKPVLSCCTLAATVRGRQVTTIEGLATGSVFHPIQQAFLDHGAIQCGFCTPGMILIAKAMLEENPHPSKQEVKEALGGNLCRCTGYVKIVDSVMAAAQAIEKAGKQGE